MSSDEETPEGGEEELGGELAEVLGDALPDVLGVPLPKRVKRSFWRATARLVTGATDIGAAWFEAKAQSIRTEGAARDVVTMAAAKAAAVRFGGNEELGERAVQHFASRIVKEQINREETLRVATEELRQDPPPEDSDEEIEEDWLNQFADIAAKVSNEDMQTYLGKILAGEIRKPGSFSAASILTLTTISRQDAQRFETLCNISLGHGDVKVLATPYGDPGNNALAPLGLSYTVLCELRVAGLLLPDITSQTNFDDWPYTESWEFCRRLARLRPLEGDPPKLGDHSIILFSRAGVELRKILSLEPNPQYVEKLQEMLRTKYNSEMVYFLQDGTLVVAGKE